MIAAIILAAGSSRRMGKQKLLLPYRGKTMIEHIVHEVIHGGIASCWVVTGCDHDQVASRTQSQGACVVYNKQHLEGGMLSSVRCGLSAIPSSVTGILLFLGDQPGISSALIGKMCHQIQNTQPSILVPVFRGKRGHPLYFNASYIPTIMQCYEDVGLKGLLHAFPDKITEWECEVPEVLIDLDTPKDYEKWMKRGGSSFS